MLRAAIVWLMPMLGPTQAGDYAALVERNARQRKVDPLLVAAIIKVESGGWRRARSRTNDYGLMQLHVSRRTHKRFRGREHLLYEPARNIRLGVKMLAFWKRHHRRHCREAGHYWWAHYNWGYRVRSRVYGRKVLKHYRRLTSRFAGSI